MRKLSIVLVCALVVTGMMFLAGCPKFWSIKLTPSADQTIKVNNDAVEGETATLDVTLTNDAQGKGTKASMNWTASIANAPAWVTVSPAKSTAALAAAGTAKITVSVDSAAALAAAEGEAVLPADLVLTVAGTDVAKAKKTQVKSATLKIKVEATTPAQKALASIAF